jgi:hypothetical protein
MAASRRFESRVVLGGGVTPCRRPWWDSEVLRYVQCQTSRVVDGSLLLMAAL